MGKQSTVASLVLKKLILCITLEANTYCKYCKANIIYQNDWVYKKMNFVKGSLGIGLLASAIYMGFANFSL